MEEERERFASLCDHPTGTRGEEWVGGHGPDIDWLQSLPGYQQMWTDDAGTIIHLATTADPTETEQLVRDRYTGLLCVGAVAGPTWVERLAARDRVGAHAEELGALSMGIGDLEDGHTVVSLTVLVDTDEVRLQIAELVGSDMAAWTRITGSLRMIR